MIYLTDEARFQHLLDLPEGADLGKAVNAAMRAVEEEHNPELAGVLPKGHISSYTKDLEGDAFGLVYEFLANIVRLYRGREPEFDGGSAALLDEQFPQREYRDVIGLCCVSTIEEIEAQGWSLNPGRYVGTEVEDLDDEVFVGEARGRADRAARAGSARGRARAGC